MKKIISIELVANSALPILPKKIVLDMLTEAGLSADGAESWLKLVGWSPPDYYDMQYKPIVRIGDRCILLPRILSQSSAMRNVLASSKSRAKDAGTLFTKEVATTMGNRFRHVATERELSGGKETGDVDVAILEGGKLYIFECKYSLSGASTHELSDLWYDIEKGASQAQKCKRMIATKSPKELSRLLKEWFPQSLECEREGVEVAMGVIASFRPLTGCDIDGVPIRDWFSFRNLIGDGVVEVVENSGEELVGHRWSLWKGNDFSVADLDDYLSSGGLFDRIRTEDIAACSHVELDCGDVGMARESVVLNFPNSMDELRSLYKSMALRELDSRIVNVIKGAALDSA